MRKRWEIKKLGDIATFQRGLTYSKKDEVAISSNIVLRSNNVDLSTNLLDLSELKYIKDSIKIPEDKRVSKGSLIICTANGSKVHLGKVALIDKSYEYAFGGFMGQLTPSKEVDSKYLFFALTSDSYKMFIGNLSDGANINNLKFDDLKEFSLPIPSLPEQKRIVAILDEVFAAIDKAKANTQKNLQNAKELFESYLQGVFENKGEDWEEKRLKEIASVFGGYSFKSKDFKSSGMYQVLRMGNIRPGIIRNEESPVFIEKVDESVLKRALLKKDDVVITQTGTKKKRDYGFTVIIDKDNYLVNQRIAAIRFPGNYLSKFFLYYSWTNYFKDQYFANETGTVGQGNVGIGAVTDALVPFCSIEEQRRVVSDIDTILFHTNKLETIHQKKLDDLEELKKSILQKAFNGELTEKNILV